MVSADASQGSAVGCSGSNESSGMCASSRGARPRACTQAKAAAAAAASTAGSALVTGSPTARTPLRNAKEIDHGGAGAIGLSAPPEPSMPEALTQGC